MTNSNRHGEAVKKETANSLSERIEQLKQLVPEACTEGKIDWDKLRAALGEFGDERPERYAFTWAGKRDAIRLLQTPSRATLVPAKDESVNFDATQHVFIEGDNLEALKLLYKSYFGRVKMIYIDPPYNTGNDFIYPDNYADPLDTYLKITGQRDSNGNLLTSNPETNGRYHSAWLSMMYPRLFLARQLLREDGTILVSIDDAEVANLKLLINEVFGEENFVAHIVWQKRYVSNVTAKLLSDMHDHILVYARQRDSIKVNKLPRTDEQLEDYKNPDNDPRGLWRAQDLSASKPYSAGLFTITTPAGLEFDPPPGRYWRCNKVQYEEWLKDNRIWFGKNGKGRPMLKAFLSEVQQGLTPNTWWSHDFAGHNKEATLEVKELFEGASPFDTAKPVKLVRRMLELFTAQDSLILDFFAGSCTTAQAVLELNREEGGNRRFIMVQLPEPTDHQQFPTIADIGKERIRRVIERLKEESNGKLDLRDRESPEDLGFRVFKLAASNYKQWTREGINDAQSYIAQMEMFLNPLLAGWTAENVIYEVAIKEGYGLNCRIEKIESVKENTIYRVTDPDKEQKFLICLDDAIKLDALKPLNLAASDLFICRDVALDNTTGANLALQCRLKTI
jgi:adenine-specific DNA-methyltransferase